MAFVSAMSATKTGVNGATVFTEEGVGDTRVSLFTMLTRGLEPAYIEDAVARVFATGDEAAIEDLFVMAFQTRDVRGGKGERALFYAMMAALYKHRAPTVLDLLHLVPEYGCWRDLWELHRRIPNTEFRRAIYALVKRQLADDSCAVRPSLLAKWLPREGSKTYRGLAACLADALYPDMYAGRCRMASYRRLIAGLNRRLDTPEIHMCDGTWSDIKPAHVPGRSRMLHNEAFLNLNANGHGIRHPHSEDRMCCRNNFLEHLAAVKAGHATMKGANVVQPHEIVQRLSQRYLDADSRDVLEAQWSSIRDAVVAAGGFRRAVAMCDFSGSMAGTPMTVSKALGILISETTAPAFRDHVLTFSTTPVWHSFRSCATMTDKIQSIGRAGVGLSTDFYRACMMILERLVASSVPVGEEPEDLIVLTDMGWDAANAAATDKQTIIQRIRAEFAAAGNWKMPRIIVWNLRAEYKDFQARAVEEGVVMVSGWSPNILAALVKNGVRTMTPLEGLRAALDVPRYDAVRQVVRA